MAAGATKKGGAAGAGASAVGVGAPTTTVTAEQQRVIDRVLDEGKSVFFTGAAGTGKSFLLRALIRRLGELGRGDSTFVTGTTGIASCNVGG